jgi:hypothetical protein
VIKSIAQTKRAKRAVRKRPDSRPILDVGRPRELPLASRPNNGIREEHLAAVLAERVMRWGVGPDRFLLSNRRWLPRWRFQPTENIADAFQLLDAADLVDYDLHADRNGLHTAKVRTSGASGEASCSSMPRAICIAIARAYGIHVEASE